MPSCCVHPQPRCHHDSRLPPLPLRRYDNFDPVLEDGGNLEILLPSGNVTERRLALAPYRPSDEFVYSGRGDAEGERVRAGSVSRLPGRWRRWSPSPAPFLHTHVAWQPLFGVETQWLTLDLAVYNPMLNAFAPVRLEARASPTGVMVSIIDVQGSILFNGRFQPSITFQVVLVLVIVVQAVIMWRDAARAGVRRWGGNGWNMYAAGGGGWRVLPHRRRGCSPLGRGCEHSSLAATRSSRGSAS